MQNFDAALLKLYRAGRISLDEALKNADSVNNLRLKISLSSQDPERESRLGTLSLQAIAEPEEEAEEEAPATAGAMLGLEVAPQSAAAGR